MKPVYTKTKKLSFKAIDELEKKALVPLDEDQIKKRSGGYYAILLSNERRSDRALDSAYIRC